MSFTLCFHSTPSSLLQQQTHKPSLLLGPRIPPFLPESQTRRRLPTFTTQMSSVHANSEHHPVIPPKPRWVSILDTAASLYPLYVTIGGAVACFKPSTFSWFVKRAPNSYSLALGFIMLAMGLTLKLSDFLDLLLTRPWAILFGCAAQFTIMPASALMVSKFLGLSSALSVGLILLGCCPGGTASNVVTLIAQGDVPLSIVMTTCTTLSAVLLTPLLTKILAGTYVPVDAVKLSISTLQVVGAPLLLGSFLQGMFPAAVKAVAPFTPLLAVLASSLLAISVFSDNTVHLNASMTSSSLAIGESPIVRVQSYLTGEVGLVILSVVLLHFSGFLVGYISAAICGFREKQRRAISIEVGMQNSSLGVVLATSQFTSPVVALPLAMSAVIMNIMGSSLGFFWRYVDPSESKYSAEIANE